MPLITEDHSSNDSKHLLTLTRLCFKPLTVAHQYHPHSMDGPNLLARRIPQYLVL